MIELTNEKLRGYNIKQDINRLPENLVRELRDKDYCASRHRVYKAFKELRNDKYK